MACKSFPLFSPWLVCLPHCSRRGVSVFPEVHTVVCLSFRRSCACLFSLLSPRCTFSPAVVTPVYLLSHCCHPGEPSLPLLSPRCTLSPAAVTPVYLLSLCCHPGVPYLPLLSPQCTLSPAAVTPVYLLSLCCHPGVPSLPLLSPRCTFSPTDVTRMCLPLSLMSP